MSNRVDNTFSCSGAGKDLSESQHTLNTCSIFDCSLGIDGLQNPELVAGLSWTGMVTVSGKWWTGVVVKCWNGIVVLKCWTEVVVVKCWTEVVVVVKRWTEVVIVERWTEVVVETAVVDPIATTVLAASKAI